LFPTNPQPSLFLKTHPPHSGSSAVGIVMSDFR
jgi:hypothetical protein